MFTLVYPEQFSDDGEGESEEVVDWTVLTERLRCHRTWEEEQRLKTKKKRKMDVARGIQMCDHCADKHKSR